MQFSTNSIGASATITLDSKDPQSILKFPAWSFLIFGTLIPAIFLAVGVYFYFSYATIEKTWVDTPAVVISSQVADSRDSHNNVTYSPSIEYQYNVSERQYKGVVDASGSSSYSSAQETVDQYPVQTLITVKVDPANPAKSSWRVGSLWWVWLLMGVGSVSMLIFGYAGSKAVTLKRKVKAWVTEEKSMDEIRELLKA